MSQELKHTVEMDFTVVKADTLEELSDKINKELYDSGVKVKHFYALLMKTTKSTKGIA